MSYKQQLVEIPWPRPTSHVYRGKNRPKQPDTYPISIRLTEAEDKEITTTANALGMTRSELMRWCTHYASLAINNEMSMQEFKEPAQPKPVRDPLEGFK